MPKVHDRQSTGNAGDTEGARLEELQKEQRRELTRTLYQELHKGGNPKRAQEIGEQFETLQQPEDAAVAYETAFYSGAKTGEVILKVVKNYISASNNDAAKEFLQSLERLSNEDKDIQLEWIGEARRLIPYPGRLHGTSYAEIAEPIRTEKETTGEIIPAGQYIMRLVHFKKNSMQGKKESERVYKKEVKPIGPIQVGIRGITLPALLDKARGVLVAALKGEKETPGKIAVEIIDPRNDRVMGSFDENVKQDGTLKLKRPQREEVITKEKIDAILRSYGIDPQEKIEPVPELKKSYELPAIKRQREKMMQGVRKVQEHIDRLSTSDCKRARKALANESGARLFEGMARSEERR